MKKLEMCIGVNKSQQRLDTLKNNGKGIVLYGAGEFCKGALEFLLRHGIKPLAICDSDINKIGQDFYGYKIASFNRIQLEYVDFDVLITALKKYDEIKEYLLQYIENERISQIGFINENDIQTMNILAENKWEEMQAIYSKLFDSLSKKTYEHIVKAFLCGDVGYYPDIVVNEQYFSQDIIKLREDEVFCDVGAYDGDTLLEFIKNSQNSFKQIYCFEPFEEAFSRLANLHKEYLKNDDRIQLFNCGLYSENGSMHFEVQQASGGNKISLEKDSRIKVKVAKMDDLELDKPITFIKMDIEGSELEALKGAENTIRKYKPKLAIAVYHERKDLIEIPQYIMNLGLDYKYYIRHYGRSPMWQYETIFYAL